MDRLDGQYYHFGIESGLEWLSRNGVLPNVLKLQFNLDGLPLFKSSATEFWPILCLVQNSDTHPFVVRLYCGNKKPASFPEYLEGLIADLKCLVNEGIVLREVHHQVVIDCFVCDAPARAFLKNVKT